MDNFVPTAADAQAIGTVAKPWAECHATQAHGKLYIVRGVAGGTIRAGRCVGGITPVERSGGTLGDLGAVEGVALHAALLGEPVEMVFRGVITDPAFSFAAGAVWLGLGGIFTQTPPSVAGGYIFSQKIGVALDATNLSVAIEPPILLV